MSKREVAPPRLSVDLTEEQKSRLSNAVPWGLMKPLFQSIVEQIVEIGEKYGELGIYAIISKKFSLVEMLRVHETMTKREEGDETQ